MRLSARSQGWTVQLMVKRAGLAMPEFAADAQRFRPERWLGEDGSPIKDPKGYMPFGEGPRKWVFYYLLPSLIV